MAGECGMGHMGRPHGSGGRRGPEHGRSGDERRSREHDRRRDGSPGGDRGRRDRGREGPGDRGRGTNLPKRERAQPPAGRAAAGRAAGGGTAAGPRPRRGPVDPALPDDVTGRELDPEARAALRSLSRDAATSVARHLVMAGRLLDEDPAAAFAHAAAARRRAARIGLVREAAGIAAYHAERYAEALAELRAARRLIGSPEHLPVEADCERALGRPERALEIATSPEAAGLAPAERVELQIVAAGARRDLGQPEAAVVGLQGPALRAAAGQSWGARLLYAYADALLAAGRRDEAVTWFVRAANADRAGETDAAERLADLEGVTFLDEEEPDEEEPDDESG